MATIKQSKRERTKEFFQEKLKEGKYINNKVQRGEISDLEREGYKLWNVNAKS